MTLLIRAVTGTVTRTYLLTDICGNKTTVTQNILIDFKLLPEVITIPVLPSDCRISAPYKNYNSFYAEGGRIAGRLCNNNPDNIKLEFIKDITDGKTCPKTITRYYKVTDECGNITIFTQKTTIDDKVPPIIICPPAITGVSHKAIPEPYTLDEFLAAGGDTADNCGIAKFEVIYNNSVRNGAEIIVTRVYRVTDFCGLSADCSHLITAKIDEPITISCPPLAPAEVECYSDLPSPMKWYEFVSQGGSATSYFGIDTASFILITQVPASIECSGIVTRTYEIRDSLGRIATCSQEFTVNDKTRPVMIESSVIDCCNRTKSSSSPDQSGRIQK